jgi:tetratricopeptide (TPR) repeat protein
MKILEDKAPRSIDLAKLYNNIGFAYNNLKNDTQEQYDNAIKYLEKAIEIREKEAPNSSGLSILYNNIGFAYGKKYNKSQDNDDKKLATLYKQISKKIGESLEEAPNSPELANLYNEIGLAYKNKYNENKNENKNYTKLAKTFYAKSKEIKESLKKVPNIINPNNCQALKGGNRSL